MYIGINQPVAVVGGLDSSNVIYNQGSTGAVDTTVHTKLQETVSVKDFGALGDGVTDDTAAIQAAVTAIGTTGRTLIFPIGDYLCTTALTPLDNQTWVGESWTKSRIINTTLNGGIITINAKTNCSQF